MRDIATWLEIIVSWFLIIEILTRMIEGGLLVELQNLIKDIRRKRT